MMHSLPFFVRLAGRPVILIGTGDGADAKRRLLERAGAVIVGEDESAALAIVAVADGSDMIVARLKARGILVNAVDRPDLCDFTLPSILDRDPVLIAIGTGGASACQGRAAAVGNALAADTGRSGKGAQNRARGNPGALARCRCPAPGD
jgi:uroporphyrin-III C-methyltransferase / precorrin-2 dehydrogenase / sirohydrochlorin ferrochelatase